jgi:hypothetical protein
MLRLDFNYGCPVRHLDQVVEKGLIEDELTEVEGHFELIFDAVKVNINSP